MFGQSIVVHRTAAAAALDQNELRANWACKPPAAGGGHRGSCTEHLASPPLRPQFRRVNFPLQATSLPSARLTVCIIHHERPAIGRSSARQRAAGRRTPARSYALMSQGYHSAVISAGTAAGSAAVARRAAQFPHKYVCVRVMGFTNFGRVCGPSAQHHTAFFEPVSHSEWIVARKTLPAKDLSKLIA